MSSSSQPSALVWQQMTPAQQHLEAERHLATLNAREREQRIADQVREAQEPAK